VHIFRTNVAFVFFCDVVVHVMKIYDMKPL
jgi:hypothetical protein